MRSFMDVWSHVRPYEEGLARDWPPETCARTPGAELNSHGSTSDFRPVSHKTRLIQSMLVLPLADDCLPRVGEGSPEKGGPPQEAGPAHTLCHWCAHPLRKVHPFQNERCIKFWTLVCGGGSPIQRKKTKKGQMVAH